MITFFIVIAILIYLVGVWVYTETETIEDVKFHEGGFLGMGYTTHSNKDVEPWMVRKGLLWPLLGLLEFIKVTLWLLHEEVILLIFLLFGFRYKKTEIYKKINSLLDN